MPHALKITSSRNLHVKEALSLWERKTRGSTGLILVEGHREILRAKEAGVIFQKLFVCPEYLNQEDDKKLLEDFKKTKVQILETTKEIFSKVSFGERKEGFVAICQRPELTWKDLDLKKNAIFVVVEGVEKPGNLGAILRSCDGAGVDGVILCDEKVDSFNPNVIRASLGTVFSLKVIESTNDEVLSFLRNQKITICASLVQAETIYSDADFLKPIAIVLGSEEKGLSDFWIKNSDIKVKIPMLGSVDSLNVSNTAAILVYEILRQRRQNLKV